MNLKNLNDADLLAKTEVAARLEREATTCLLWHLWEVDRRKLYANVGTRSLFDYCVRVLKMSEPQAARRVNAARALAEFPELETKINSGALTLTATSQAQSYFKREARAARPVETSVKREIFSSLENRSVREADKILFSHTPDPVLHGPEVCRQVNGGFTELRLTLDQETVANLERLKDLWSHQMPAASFSDVIEKMAQVLVNQVDLIRKAQKINQRNSQNNNQKANRHTEVQNNKGAGLKTSQHVEIRDSVSDTLPPELMMRESMKGEAAPTAFETSKREAAGPKRKVKAKYLRQREYIPASIRHHVWLSEGGQCTYKDQKSGRVCGSRYQLQIDHTMPVALGGSKSPENLRLRCATHNQFHARQTFGVSQPKRHIVHHIDLNVERKHSALETHQH